MAIEVQFSDLMKLLDSDRENGDSGYSAVASLDDLRSELMESTLEVLDILHKEHHIGATEIAKQEVRQAFSRLSDEFITHTTECHSKIEGGALALWRIAMSPDCPANIKAVILQVGYQAGGKGHAEPRENGSKTPGHWG